MNFVFIVERYNDLDMAAPVIWKCSTLPNANVVILNAQPRRTPAHDFRLAFLRKSPHVRYVEIPRENRGPLRRLRRWWLEKIHFKHLRPAPDPAHHADVLDFDFDALPVRKDEPGVVVTFYNSGHPAALAACRWAEKRSFATVLANHGVCPLRISPDAAASEERTCRYDAIIVNNENSARFYTDEHYQRLLFCGSPRFSREWSATYSEILPRPALRIKPAPFCVVFMLSKWKDADSRDALLSAIRAAARLDGATVLVKPHTRGMDFSATLPDNVLILDEEIHSRQLIELADALVFTRSSIFLDAVLLDKPVIRLEYATSSELASDSLAQCAVDSEERLLELLELVRRGLRSYSPEARSRCLEFYAGDDRDGLLVERYAATLEGLARQA